MSLKSAAWMAATLKATQGQKELVDELNKMAEFTRSRTAVIRDLEKTTELLRGMAGTLNDRLAVARSERNGYRSLTMHIVNEIKGAEPRRLSLPEADKERQEHLLSVYNQSLQDFDQAIQQTYAKMPPEERAQMLNNEVRRKGGGKLIKDVD